LGPSAEVGADRFLGETSKSWEEEDARLAGEGDLGMEIMSIFSQPSANTEGVVPPPSRNSNPLVKDKRFSKDRSQSDTDALASSLAHSLATQQLDGRDKRSSECDFGMTSS